MLYLVAILILQTIPDEIVILNLLIVNNATVPLSNFLLSSNATVPVPVKQALSSLSLAATVSISSLSILLRENRRNRLLLFKFH